MREFLDALRTLCACFCLFALGMAGLQVGTFLDRIWPREQTTMPGILADAKSEALTLVDTRMRLLQESAEKQIAETRKDLNAQLTSTRRELLTETNGARQDVQFIAGRYERLLEKQAGSLMIHAELSQIALRDTLSGVDAVTGQTAALLKQINEAAPMYLDCDAGMCLANQIYSTSAAIRKTAEGIAKETPETAASVKRTSQAIDKIATKFARDKRWWEKVGSALVVGGSIAVRAVF